LEEGSPCRGDGVQKGSRGVAERGTEFSKFCKAVIEGRIISSYVFPRTKYICGYCGEVSIGCHGGWSMRCSLM
jgi:hypothetical protein